MSRFPPHGRLRTTQLDRILVAEHTGPFNLEYWEAAAPKVFPLIESLERTGPYGLVVLFQKSALSSLEAMDVVIERNRGFAAAHPNCVGVAVAAAPEVEGREIMLDQFMRYLQAIGGAPASTLVCLTLEEATTFLRERLAGRAHRT
jgi:hypothetical protein